jgi:hypothetical protein
MMPVFRAKKRAAQNANQEVARVATALYAVFSSASLSSDAPQGLGYKITQAVFRPEKRAMQNAMLPLNAAKGSWPHFSLSDVEVRFSAK